LQTIGLYSIKGGVGKTAACVNLTYLAAREGKKTLLSDLDPQGSATFYFRIRSPEKLTAKVFLKHQKKRYQAIKATDFRFLDLLPAVLSYRLMDIRLNRLKHPKRQLRTIYQNFCKDYDYVLIDCPPNITLVSENIFRTADILLVPVIPTTLSILTLEKLVEFFKNKKLPMKKIVPFFSMVERRKKLHNSIIEEYKQSEYHFLKAGIPYSADVEKMGINRQPLFLNYPNSPAALAYRDLWDEVKQLIP
jgi:cellulose biosynthesis protein BcsQ